MEKNLNRIVIATLAVLLLAPVQSAFAEPTEMDRRILELAQEDQTSSLIFMEVKLFEKGGTTPELCQEVWVSMVSDKGISRTFRTQISPTLFGQALESSTYGGASVAPAGTYTILQVWCKGTIRLKGRFARFALQPGQVSNLGCLVIDYTRGPFNPFVPRTFTGRTRVEDLSPNALASLTKLASASFSEATKQYMASNPGTSKATTAR
jgi:hypothetical protein